ncbi:hypothetical protein NPIL_695621 [Nephila pilipes]|uniref:Uncharacterized protein n=1 Tax=Nephila pilipes TaxID=299642 RepID=A0A8X6UM68_NEPPI|nr:hypothetical protein NPIL_695621 [Nephila pilipes]
MMKVLPLASSSTSGSSNIALDVPRLTLGESRSTFPVKFSETAFHSPQDNSRDLLKPAHLFTDTVNKESPSAPSSDVIIRFVDIPVL